MLFTTQAIRQLHHGMLYSTVVADHVTTAGFLQGLQGKFVESTGNGTWRATTWTYASGSSSRTMTSSTAFATSLSAWTQVYVVAHVLSVTPHSRILLRGHLSLPRDEPNGCANGSTRDQDTTAAQLIKLKTDVGRAVSCTVSTAKVRTRKTLLNFIPA